MITSSSISIEEAVETLTGYEEQEIEKRFGAQFDDLLEVKPITGMRAVAAVMIARDLKAQGASDPQGQAYAHVMEMTLRQASEFWSVEDEPEAMPDEPDTESGKDDSTVVR